MSELNIEIAPEVVAACKAGAEEAAGALSRSLDREFSLSVGEAASYASDSPPAGFEGPGLAVLMTFGDIGLVGILPESSGLLPDWYAAPDPTGESKLSTLAQELSMLLVPETFMADDFQAARVEQITASLAAASLAGDAALVPLELTSGDEKAQLNILWPLDAPTKLLPEPAQEIEETPASPAPQTPAVGAVESTSPLDFAQLPSYTRSLLKTKVPVSVVLASKKQSLRDVVELASGSIVQFEKGCEDLLELFVGDQAIAEGEAVKIGDKFGFRVNEMKLPDEHFMPVRPKNAG